MVFATHILLNFGFTVFESSKGARLVCIKYFKKWTHKPKAIAKKEKEMAEKDMKETAEKV